MKRFYTTMQNQDVIFVNNPGETITHKPHSKKKRRSHCNNKKDKYDLQIKSTQAKLSSHNIKMKVGSNQKTSSDFEGPIPTAPIPVPAVYPSIKFYEFVYEWLLIQKNLVRQNTYEIYKITAETHIIPYFKSLDVIVQQVNTLHIQHYFTVKLDEGLSGATLKKHYTIINGTL